MNKQTTKGSHQTPINSPTPSYLQPRPFAVQAQADTTTQGVEKPELQSEEEKVQRSRIDLMEVMMAASSPSDPPNRLQAQAETPTQMVKKPELQSNGKKVQRSRIDLMEIMMAASSPNVQAKLEIGEVGDKYEQEADRVASQVVSQINNPVQKKLQRLSESKVIRRKEAIAGGTASADLESSIQSARGSGQSLDANLQQSMGQAMGADFSGVKVHTDSQSDQLNKSIQAKAFTTGQDVFFRQGAYEPSSRGGQELIAHELTHVVQQGAANTPLQRQGISGGKKTIEDFYGGSVGAVAKGKAGLEHATEQNMSLVDQGKSIKTKTARNEKEMLASIANGQMPRYVARVNSRDGFTDYKTFGDARKEFIFATEPADLRGATPGGALIKVGWTKAWLQPKIGKEIVVCILDTQKAVPTTTGNGDAQMTVHEMGWPEIIAKAMGDTRFKAAGNNQGIADDAELRSALEVCKATPVKDTPNSADPALNQKAEKVRIMLNDFYGANELYTGMSATMNTQGQLGVREVMISNNDTGLKLTPQNHVLESLGTLSQQEYDNMQD